MLTLRFQLVKLLVLIFTIISACAVPTKTEVKFEYAQKLRLTGEETVVLFPTFSERTGASEANFIRCLKQDLEQQISHRISIVDTRTFQDATFPWFEADHAPSNIQELDTLLSRHLVQERIISLGVRYIVNITSSSDADGFPGMICGGGFGAAGCLGLAWEDKTHTINAIIWDVAKIAQAGSLSTTTSGKSLAFALVIPIVFVADTERDACKALATELGQLLTGAMYISH